MNIKTSRLTITTFSLDMAQSVYENSQDDDTRRFVPDEVYDSVEEARAAIEFLGHCRKKGFYSFCCIALSRKLFCNVIADFPGTIINLAKLNIADVFAAVICDYWIYKWAIIGVV